MTNTWQTLWQRQCEVWLDSLRRNGGERSVQYDFEQHRLTLVPRSCYNVDHDTMDVPYLQLKPLISIMDSQLMEYDIRMDCSYKLAPTITVDRVHIYLDGAEAITHLAMVVPAEVLHLEGGMGRRDP